MIANVEEYDNALGRHLHRQAGYGASARGLAEGASQYWLERLHSADILCGPINTFAEIVADPALASNLPLIDPQLPGVPRVMGTPIKFNGVYFPADRPPPAKGQHTREVLSEFGFGDEEIDSFFRSRSAYAADAA